MRKRRSTPTDRCRRSSPSSRSWSPIARAPPGRTTWGYAVPLRLRAGAAELRLLTTLTHVGTALDVTVSELRLEAFLPADAATAAALEQGAL